MTRRAAVFLDRDGVLNEVDVVDGTPHPPATAGAVIVLPGVLEACTRFREAGLELVVVTNQPDIGRGTTTEESVEAINDVLRNQLPITEFRVCPHDDHHACDCRKPKPGLLIRAATELHVDLGRSVMVGDRWRDIDAGRAAGMPSVWIDRGYRERPPSLPDLTVTSLIEAVDWILDTIAHRSSS